MDVCLFFMDDFKHSLRLIPSKYRRRQLNYFGSVHGREQALPCCCWLVNHSPFVETMAEQNRSPASLRYCDPPPPCGIALPRLHLPDPRSSWASSYGHEGMIAEESYRSNLGTPANHFVSRQSSKTPPTNMDSIP